MNLTALRTSEKQSNPKLMNFIRNNNSTLKRVKIQMKIY